MEKAKHPGGRPLMFPTGEILGDAIAVAINQLVSEKRPIIVENIALELDCSASTLRHYGERADFDPQFVQPIKRMLDFCQAWQVSQLYSERGQVAGAIFALKNNYPEEYRDRQEIEQRSNNTNFNVNQDAGPADKSTVDDLIGLLKDQTAKEA